MALSAATTLLAAPVSAAPALPGDSVGGVGIRLSANRVQYTVSVRGAPNGPIGSFLYRAVDFRLAFGGPVKFPLVSRATCPDAATTAHDAFDVQGNFVVRDL